MGILLPSPVGFLKISLLGKSLSSLVENRAFHAHSLRTFREDSPGLKLFVFGEREEFRPDLAQCFVVF